MLVIIVFLDNKVASGEHKPQCQLSMSVSYILSRAGSCAGLFDEARAKRQGPPIDSSSISFGDPLQGSCGLSLHSTIRAVAFTCNRPGGVSNRNLACAVGPAIREMTGGGGVPDGRAAASGTWGMALHRGGPGWAYRRIRRKRGHAV